MVAQLLRLRLLSIANGLRFGLRQGVATVVALLVVVLLSLALSSATSILRSAPLPETRALVVGAGTLLLVVFLVAPFASSRAAWTEPRRLAGFGFGTDLAAGALALCGLIGLPVLALVILAFGYVRAWGPDAVGPAIVGAVLAGLTAYLLGLVASSVDALVTTRRARDLLVAGGVLVGLVLVPLVVDLIRVATPGDYRGSGAIADALAWTPFGAALALPGHVLEGRTGRATGDVVIAAVTLGLLWWAWRSLVFHALNRPLAREVSTDRRGLGWFDFTRATPAGAIAARSLTYWARDARYRWSLVILPFLPLLVIPLGIVGADWSWLALVPVPVMCLLVGFLPHNDVAYDNTALWMHVAANTSGLADRLGRIAPALVLGLPIAVVGSLVASVLHGDLGAFGPEFGVCLSLLLCGLGLSSILSAALPYAAVRPGDDPFQQPQATGSAAGWSQSIMIGGALLLTLPAGWLAVLATLDDRPGDGTAALWVGIGTGVVVAAVGIAAGARVFARRAPELLAFALRS